METKESIDEMISYRTPMKVTEFVTLPYGDGFSVCPKCKTFLDREYQAFCTYCGQKLDWKGFSRCKVMRWKRK